MLEVAGKVANGTVAVTLEGYEMASFDLEGRILYYSAGSASYRRSIYNELYRLEWAENQERIVNKIENPYPLLERAYEIARIAVKESRDPSLVKSLELPSIRTSTWLENDAKRATQIYGRISIVPPDLYFSIYLQLTTGCTWNLCTFCNLYRERNYAVRTAGQFAQHAKEVGEFLGKGLSARRSIFLGDANAMDVSYKLLKNSLLTVSRRFPSLPVYSFVDAFTTPKNLERMNYTELHELGLKRVYLGLESGDPEVLKILNKPMAVEEAEEFVKHVKKAGVNIGLIILIGAGGRKLWDDHVSLTCSAIENMKLGQGDILYLSPLVETEVYSKLVSSLNLGELSSFQKEKQMGEITDSLRKSGKVNCPTVRYDIRESFVS